MRVYASRAALFLSLLLMAVTRAVKTDMPDSLVRGHELVFSGKDFAAGVHEGGMKAAGGLTLDAASVGTGTYTSPPIAAPLPFSDVGALWESVIPAGAGYTLELRTSLDGRDWLRWSRVEPDPDFRTPERQEVAGNLIPVPQSDRVHRFVQYRWSFSAAPDGSTPLLRRLRLAFIDSGVSPQSVDAHSALGLPQPAAVSRTGWGCPDGEDSPDWPPVYEPVTHIIVHHTVTPNDDTDLPARVRSIWYYHAITRGWGDIGYNYLLDREGTLYHGRAGGDDVVAGHAYPYNPGSLGVAFIGTFSSAPVPQPMVDVAAELLAWKMEQKGLDPHGWGWLHDRWLPRIMGHRDVSQTACPGDVLYAHLPLLRDEAASELSAAAHTYVDELEAQLSDANWHDGPEACGYRGHAYWTFSTTNPDWSANWATWQPDLPEAGPYLVLAFVPYCINGHTDSAGVQYRVHHAGGDSAVTVSQAAAAGGWVELGLFEFDAGTGGTVSLDDVALDDGNTIWFDTVKWSWEGDIQPPENSSPIDDSWSTSEIVQFQWSPSPSPHVDHYRLLIATDPELTDRIHDTIVDPSEPGYSYSFADDQPQVYWGVQAHGSTGYSPPSGPWGLGVDTVAPTASVTQVYLYPDGHYTVHWSGEDATSGVATFDIEYRQGPAGAWTAWLTGTTRPGARFPYPVAETVWFRCRAQDAAGNRGGFDGGTMSTADATLLDHALWVPQLSY